MTLAVDISNYTGPINTDQVQAWRDADVGLVIVQALDPPAGFPPGCTQQQLQTLAEAGMPAEAYIFYWFEADPSHVDRALALLEGQSVRRVWLDLEDVAAQKFEQAPTEAKVADALARIDAWSEAHKLPPAGIYTGRWFWADERYMANTETFKDRDLWDANYDSIPDAGQGFRAYGGWTSCTIKQHKGTSTLGGVGGLDLDCLSEEYAKQLGLPPARPPETPESITCPPVPQDYQDKFGVGADGWPGVAANLEGIIHLVMAQVQQVTLQEKADAAKLDQIRALVADFRSGTLDQIREVVAA